MSDVNDQQKSTDTNEPLPCTICNKKSIYNMVCRCSESLCRRHWNPTKHNCAFDFAAHENHQNTKRLAKIQQQKVSAI